MSVRRRRSVSSRDAYASVRIFSYSTCIGGTRRSFGEGVARAGRGVHRASRWSSQFLKEGSGGKSNGTLHVCRTTWGRRLSNFSPHHRKAHFRWSFGEPNMQQCQQAHLHPYASSPAIALIALEQSQRRALKELRAGVGVE